MTDKNNSPLHIYNKRTTDDRIKRLYAVSVNPDDFLRLSGEEFARADAAWKSAKNSGKPLETHICDFLAIGLVHLDALNLCGLHREALMAMISMLISIDMTRVDIHSLGANYIDLHERFLLECCRLCRECENDDYARPHADAILLNDAIIFLSVTSTLQSTNAKIAGLVEGCRGIIADSTIEDVDSLKINLPELYVDIFSRIHAINS